MSLYTEIKVENIEPEICAGRKPLSERLAIDRLLLALHVEAEHTERKIESDTLDDKHAYTGHKVQFQLGDIGMGSLRLPVVRAREVAASGAYQEVNLIKHAEPALTRDAEILPQRYRGGIALTRI